MCRNGRLSCGDGNPGILITGDNIAEDNNGSTKSIGENELKTFVSKTIVHRGYYLWKLWQCGRGGEI